MYVCVSVRVCVCLCVCVYVRVGVCRCVGLCGCALFRSGSSLAISLHEREVLSRVWPSNLRSNSPSNIALHSSPPTRGHANATGHSKSTGKEIQGFGKSTNSIEIER